MSRLSLADLLEAQAVSLEQKKSDLTREYKSKLHDLETEITRLRTIKETVPDVNFDSNLMANLFDHPQKKSQPREIPSELDESDETEDTESDKPKFSPSRFSGTLYERTEQYFRLTGNKLASNADIREAIGATRGSLGMVLYDTHQEKFSCVHVNPRKTLWHLAPEVWEMVKDKPVPIPEKTQTKLWDGSGDTPKEIDDPKAEKKMIDSLPQ